MLIVVKLHVRTFLIDYRADGLRSIREEFLHIISIVPMFS